MSDLASLSPPPEFSPIDLRFADFIGAFCGQDPEVKLAAALVSHARSLGHVCLDLHALARGELDPALIALAGAPAPNPIDWIRRILNSAAVGRPTQFKPLVLDDSGRLYLHRYWQYESDLAAILRSQASAPAEPIDAERLRDGLNRLFPANQPGAIDWQMVAAFVALRKRLCVISGGPGTGKTRTVVILLALILEQNPEIRIALVAPTGKAAARLQESVQQTKDSLACSEEIRKKLPTQAKTIHRLLGSIQDSAYFRHNADNPLPLDLIVVDEASMVDLALMAKLASALHPSARLVLLGDKDQLASVEAGSVLADICGGTQLPAFSKAFREEFHQLAGGLIPVAQRTSQFGPLSDCLVELHRNYRFGNESGIFKLSQAVHDGNADAALDILDQSVNESADLSSRPLPTAAALKEQLRRLVWRNFQPYLTAQSPAAVLTALSRFRILSPVRSGPYGVENLNRIVREILTEAGLISGGGDFYRGRPILVTRNDYNVGLFNGDIGVILQDPVTAQLRAWFLRAGEVEPSSYLPLRLPEHETAFALTVHKSQGSEFERVLLILPKEDARIMTRELVYTGLTRASRQVELWHDPSILRSAIGRKTLRRSSLREAIWEAGPTGTR